MKYHYNIERHPTNKFEYVGYSSLSDISYTWRIRKGGAGGWEAVPSEHRHTTQMGRINWNHPDRITGRTLLEIGVLLSEMNKDK